MAKKIYWSKSKHALTWGLGVAGIIATTLAITIPIVSANDYQTDRILKDEKYNFIPTLVSNEQLEELLTNQVIHYHPNQFDQAFFANQIANQELTIANSQADDEQKATNTNDYLFSFPANEIGINYRVLEVNHYQDQLIATVEKKINDYVSTYQKPIQFPENYWQGLSVSQVNFLKVAAFDLKQAFNQNWIQIGAQKPQSTNIGDWQVKNLGPKANHDAIAIAFAKKDFYVTYNPDYKKPFNLDFATGQPVIFSLVTTNPGATNDVSDEQIIAFNQNESWINHPNASAQEWMNLPAIKWLLSIKSEMGWEDDVDLSILKNIIFDPSSDPQDENGQPLSNYQLVPFKMQLGDQVTYIMIWTDVVARSLTEIIDNAPEIAWVLDLPESQKVTMTQFQQHPENYLKPEHQVPSGLHYQYVDNSLAINQQKASFSVKISFADDRAQLSKTYQIKELDLSELSFY